MNDRTLEERVYLESKGYDEYEIEEIIDDYLPKVKAHIGFTDERSDKRFVVKFHDIFFFTDIPKDMEQDEFDMLFDMFCNEQYEGTKWLMDEKHMNEQSLFALRDIGHYRIFDKIIPELTEENYLDVTTEIYAEGLSPDYIDDYTALADHLQNMEDNYMEYWLEFLKANEVPDTTIKSIERRMKEYEEKHKTSK